MKKFIKVCLITGCICLISGIITLAVGFNVSVGSGSSGITMHRFSVPGFGGIIRNFGFSHGGDFNGFEFGKDIYDDDFFEDKHEHHKEHHKREGYADIGVDELSLEGIKEIEICSEGNSLYIEGKDGIKGLKSGEDSHNHITYKKDNDELKIYIGKCRDQEIQLYVPENMENIKTEMEFNGCEAVINNVSLDKLKIEANGCDIEFIGKVSSKLDIENIASQTMIELNDNIDQYDIEVECNAGSVTIGDESFDGMITRREIKRGSSKNIEVECNAGDVEIIGAEML